MCQPIVLRLRPRSWNCLAQFGSGSRMRSILMPRGMREYLRTSTTHIFAGDITGHLMLVPQAIQAGWVAATNAVKGPTMPLVDQVSPMGSFTEPEYAQVGLTEAKARETHDIVTSIVHFDVTTRTIIDGRTFGFCKLITDRKTCKVIGCHVIGERAVDIAEVAAIAIAAGMRVDHLTQIPLAYPTYGGILARAAVMAAGQLGLSVGWQAGQLEGAPGVKRQSGYEDARQP